MTITFMTNIISIIFISSVTPVSFQLLMSTFISFLKPKKNISFFLCLGLVLSIFSPFLEAERVSIQAGKSFCVFEDLKANVPWGIQFQSDEHEIKAVIRSPVKVLHSGVPEAYGSYSIKTEMDGRYSVCFENPSGTIQKVSFNFLGQDPINTETKNDNVEKPDLIQNEINDLNSGLKYIQNEQDYMLLRGKIHRKIADNTGSRIFNWFIFQILLVSAAVAFEIFYLKSFFEKKRVV